MGEKDDDLEREIRAHLELEAEERIANGMSHDEARDAARRAFGNVTRVREDARSVWIAPWIDHAFQDLRYAARRLRRAPVRVDGDWNPDRRHCPEPGVFSNC